jgi:hypothetical protein
MRANPINKLLISSVFIFSILIFPLINVEAATRKVSPPIDGGFSANPGIGWQNLPGHNFLDESILYRRPELAWNDLNPASGKYNWKPIDDLINQAKAKNEQVAFRISTNSSHNKGLEVPKWVIDRGAKMLGNDADYSNCVYQEEWGRFVDALRMKYDGNLFIAAIDIGGYGASGEWPYNNQTQLDKDPKNPQTLNGKARKRLANIFIGGADENHICRDKNNKTLKKPYYYKGFQKTQLFMPYAGIKQSIQYVVNKRKDVGIRYDCLGRRGSSGDIMNQIGNEINQIWKTAPIAFEFCNGGNSFDGLIKESDSLLKKSHGSIVHDNINWNKSQNKIKALMSKVGYKYHMKSIQYTDNVARNQKMNVDMIWENIGTAPSYPKMGQNFGLRLYIVDKKTGKNVAEIPISSNISRWYPASKLPSSPPENKVSASIKISSAIKPGTYELKVGIRDNRTGGKINLSTQNKDKGNRYRIGDIVIR